MQITRKTKIYCGAGVSLVLVALVFKLLVLKSPAPATAPPPPVVHHTTPVRPTAPHARTAKRTAPAAPVIDPTLPAPLRRALRHNRVVVAVLYAPGVPGDDAAVASALRGAAAAHAGFAALNTSNETVARAIATKLPGTSDPSVFIVRRPGDIRFLVDGYIDGAVVAQAARGAR